MRSYLIVLLFAAASVPASATPRPPTQTAPNTPEVWHGLEASARERLERNHVQQLLPPLHLSQHGFTAAKTVVHVEGGRCYVAIFAWSVAREMQLVYGFPRDEKGRVANASFGGDVVKAQAPNGGFRFCTDGAGDVRLSANPSGRVGREDDFEYALVIGWSLENRADAEHRRAEERALQAGREHGMQVNIARANAEQAASLRDDCRPCRDRYTSCQVARDAERGARMARRCEDDLRRCVADLAFRRGMTGERAANACGPLPP